MLFLLTPWNPAAPSAVPLTNLVRIWGSVFNFVTVPKKRSTFLFLKFSLWKVSDKIFSESAKCSYKCQGQLEWIEMQHRTWLFLFQNSDVFAKTSDWCKTVFFMVQNHFAFQSKKGVCKIWILGWKLNWRASYFGLSNLIPLPVAPAGVQNGHTSWRKQL